jgi:glycine cleavage system H protein
MSKYPATLKYTKDHEWARREGDLIRIGITEFAVEQLGEVTLVDLPAAGAKIANGAHFGDIESVKAVSELFAPVTGEVVEVNTSLASKPELVNDSPYEAGWMLLVRPASPADIDELLDSAAYEAHVGSL